MNDQILQDFLNETIAGFRACKKQAEGALEQVNDAEFFQLIDAESNSIAVICKHIGGNLNSRWADFLTTDGEKPNRDRDSEFVAEGDTREKIMQVWEAGWSVLFASLESLQTSDLNKIVQIRSEDFTVVRAIIRSALHTASHVGQITFLAKHLRSAEWKNMSVPKNKSADFNAYLTAKEDKGNYLEAAGEFAKTLADKQ